MAIGAVMVPPYIQLCDENGDPLAGGLLYSYEAGSLTWQKLYIDSDLQNFYAQPIQLDSAGRFMAYMLPLAYKFVVTKSDGSAVWTQDNVLISQPATTVTVTLPDYLTAIIY